MIGRNFLRHANYILQLSNDKMALLFLAVYLMYNIKE